MYLFFSVLCHFSTLAIMTLHNIFQLIVYVNFLQSPLCSVLPCSYKSQLGRLCAIFICLSCLQYVPLQALFPYVARNFNCFYPILSISGLFVTIVSRILCCTDIWLRVFSASFWEKNVFANFFFNCDDIVQQWPAMQDD